VITYERAFDDEEWIEVFPYNLIEAQGKNKKWEVSVNF